MGDRIPFTEVDVTAYLDRMITHWRKDKVLAEAAGDEEGTQVASCYVDAFQSARMSILGALLPNPDNEQPMNEAAEEWMGGDKSTTIPIPDSGTIGDPNRK
jgi:hypothetical protein